MKRAPFNCFSELKKDGLNPIEFARTALRIVPEDKLNFYSPEGRRLALPCLQYAGIVECHDNGRYYLVQ